MILTIGGKKLSLTNTISLQIFEIIFFMLLFISYVLVVEPLYGYMGFEKNFNLRYFIISITIILLFIILGAKLKGGIIHTIWHIVLMLCLFPQIIYFFYDSGRFHSSLGYIIFLAILFLSSRILNNKIEIEFSIKIEKLSNFYLILFISLLLFLPFLRYLPYLDISNLWLNNVYETRVLFRTIHHPNFLAYLMAPLSRVMFPALLIIALEKRKWLLVVILSLLISYLYLASGAVKSVYFGLFMALLFYMGTNFRSKLQIFIVPMVLIMILGILEFLLFGSSFLQNLAVRRIFFIPPLMEDPYYIFFANSEKTYYTHSIFSFLSETPREMSISRYIGEFVIGKVGLNANVGVIPDGFISLGWIGVVLNSSLISFLFILIDKMKINPKYFGLIFIYIYYFNTAFLGTFLLTHGFLFFIFFSLFCLRQTK